MPAQQHRRAVGVSPSSVVSANASKLCVLLIACVSGCGAPNLLRVQLPSQISTTRSTVRLGDIAEFQGGDISERRRAAALDLVQRRNAKDAVITADQVRIRMRLAGFPQETFTVSGSPYVTVTSTAPRPRTVEPRGVVKLASFSSPDADIMAAIRDAAQSRLSLPPSDIEVRLLQPLRGLQELSSSVTYRPYLPTQFGPGPHNLKVGVFEGQQLRKTVNVSTELVVYRQVPVATARIERNDTFSLKNVSLERRPLPRGVSPASADRIIGLAARREINRGDIIQGAWAGTPQAKAEPILVRSGDLVRAVVKRGGLTVTLSKAKALQSGRLGDRITVRNEKRDFPARIVSASEVRVD